MLKRRREITADDICFFNGLGDAISKIYLICGKKLASSARLPLIPPTPPLKPPIPVIPHITYNLLPEKNWLPDLKDLENKIKYNPAVSGILIINPDNPTGMVYPRKVLEQIVSWRKNTICF